MSARFTDQRTYPYLVGAAIAANAIADAYLLLDGPDCVFYKAERVFGYHDLESTLLDVRGRHRLVASAIGPDDLVTGRARRLDEALRQVATSGLPGMILVGAMPMAFITGVDYEALIDRALPQRAIPVLALPKRAIQDDWLVGYADTLETAARGVDLGEPAPAPDAVAVVGHMMDRGEGDQRGNLRELSRLCAGLGLDLVSVWPDGGDSARLREVRGAGLIVALPYGAGAARVLSERLAVPRVDAPIPFGPSATEAFLLALARATGREARAAAWIDRELSRLLPRLRWPALTRLAGRRVTYVGDPWLLPGLCDIAGLVGLQVDAAVSTAARREAFDQPQWSARVPCEVRWQPFEGELAPLMTLTRDQHDLLVTCDARHEDFASPVAVMEFGYPSPNQHFVAEAPFLGFHGVAGFTDRVLTALIPRLATPPKAFFHP
jgi:nitrogenase molybdenum-iron protein alpha/beta subunit